MQNFSEPKSSRDAYEAVHYHALCFANTLDLDANQFRRDNDLHLVHATGRATQLRVPDEWLTLCVPLADPLHLKSVNGYWEIATTQMQIWRNGSLTLDSYASGLWLALTGPISAWTRRLRTLGGGDAVMMLFPQSVGCARELRRLLIRLACTVRGSAEAFAVHTLVMALCASLIEKQRELRDRLQRCSGLTLEHRRQTLLRLLHVRHLIEISSNERFDLARLALNAHYSPGHLLRIHRQVFDETPTEYANRIRLSRAWSLVCETITPICEITDLVGFESHSAFSRAFKHTFGRTPSEVRRTQHALDSV